jgi:hypothetical protein
MFGLPLEQLVRREQLVLLVLLEPLVLQAP